MVEKIGLLIMLISILDGVLAMRMLLEQAEELFQLFLIQGYRLWKIWLRIHFLELIGIMFLR